MNLLPHWVLTDKFPAFYDMESKTAIEQTARVYAAMQELIKEYNSFVDTTNEKITRFLDSTDKNYEVFTTEIRQEFQDFIDVIDLKVLEQDTKIDNAVKYMKTNLEKTLQTAVTEALQNQNVSIAMNYYEDTERLDFVLVGGDS